MFSNATRTLAAAASLEGERREQVPRTASHMPMMDEH